MSLVHSPRIATDGLVVCLDAGNSKGYDNKENLFLYSEQYDQSSSWINQNSFETTNVVISPDGLITADKLIGNNGQVNRQSIYQTVGVTSGTTYTFSVFLKQAERRYATIWFDSPNIAEGAYYGAGTYIDLQTGTIAQGTQTKIIAYTNDWYRVYVTATPSFTGNLNLNTAIGTPNNAADGAGTIAYQYTGDGVSGFYIWGSQFEKGGLTDYTSTTTTAKNRGTSLTDLTGKSNSGILTNGPTYSTVNSGSLVFDGTNDAVRIPLSSSLQSLNFTFDIWVKSTVSNGDQMFFSSHYSSYGTASGIMCGITSLIPITGGLRRYYFATFLNNSLESISFGSQIPSNYTNLWINIVGSWNGTDKIFYFNGNQVAIQNASGQTHSQLNDFYLGNNADEIANNNYTDSVLSGNISCFKYYNRALSLTEIQQNFNALRGRYGV